VTLFGNQPLSSCLFAIIRGKAKRALETRLISYFTGINLHNFVNLWKLQRVLFLEQICLSTCLLTKWQNDIGTICS